MIIGLLQDFFNVGNMCREYVLREKSEIQKRDESQKFFVYIEYIYDTRDSVYGETMMIWIMMPQESIQREYNQEYHYGLDELPDNCYEILLLELHSFLTIIIQP